MTTTTISSKGQIVIPKHIREKLNLKKGDRVEIIECDGIINIIKIPEDPVEALKYLGKRANLKGTAKEVHEEMESWER